MARLLLALVALPLALPALMSGVLLLYVVGPFTILGELFDGKLTDTRAGIVLAQIFVAAPFLIIAARAAFAAVDPALEEVAATLGLGAGGALRARRRAGGAAGHRRRDPADVAARVRRVRRDRDPRLPPVLAAGVHVRAVRRDAAAGDDAAGRRRAGASRSWCSRSPACRSRGDAAAARRRGAVPRSRRLAAAPATLDFALQQRLGSFTLEIAHRAPARGWRCSARRGRQDDDAAPARRPAGSEGGHVRAGSRALDELPTERRQIGYVPQQPALLPRRTVWRQVTFGCRAPTPSWPRGGSSAWVCAGSRTATPRSSPADSSAASRSPARSRSSRACCCSTSRSPGSTHPCATACAASCAGCSATPGCAR